jgi:hypothetical protein
LTGSDVINKIIGRKHIAVVERVQVAANLELLEVVQARDIQRLCFGFAEGWQEQTRQNGDHCNDDQQLDQRKGRGLDATSCSARTGA